MRLLRTTSLGSSRRRVVVILGILGAGLAFVLLRAALAPDMAICGCLPPWYHEDLGIPVP